MKYCKRVLFVAIVCLVIAILTLPSPFDKTTGGTYYYGLHFGWFTSEYTAIHEAGHMRDDDLGMPSQSPAYDNAMQVVRDSNIIWRDYIDDFPRTGDYEGYDWHKEVYAEMFYARTVNPDLFPVELNLFYMEGWGN